MKNVMRPVFFFVLLLSCLTNVQAQPAFSDRIFVDKIKSVELFPENDRFGEPIIFLDNINPLILKFDDLDIDYHDYAYTLIHCDAQWRESDLTQNEYLDGYIEAFIVEFKFSENTKIPFVHYSVQIPNKDVQIRYSGNYILKVYPEGEIEKPVFTKKLYVVDPKCPIGGSVIAPSNPEIRNTYQEISFKVNIKALASQYPAREITTQIQQNGRYDNQINQLIPLSIMDGILDFDLQKENVFPGLNTFRYFSFSNLDYNSENVYSSNQTGDIDEVELLLAKFRSDKPYAWEPAQYGKFYINTKNYDDAEAESEYALVHFILSSENPIPDAEVFILGGFDLWSLSLKLVYDFKSRFYHTESLLKQGYYSYQYAVKKKNNNQVDVATIEGSFFQTPNVYFIRVYYREPSTTYDQLVGWLKLNSFED